jgi:hypothetical protein
MAHNVLLLILMSVSLGSCEWVIFNSVVWSIVLELEAHVPIDIELACGNLILNRGWLPLLPYELHR